MFGLVCGSICLGGLVGWLVCLLLGYVVVNWCGGWYCAWCLVVIAGGFCYAVVCGVCCYLGFLWFCGVRLLVLQFYRFGMVLIVVVIVCNCSCSC